jgi:NADH-quinone oxidoreductase subunit J
MNTLAVLFYIFSAILVFSAVKVVTSKNTVYAVLFLVLSFFTASCIWILLQAEFLAISLVLVYVGAVMVLFLFVVMMLDIKIEQFKGSFAKHLPLASLIGGLMAFEMGAVLMAGFKLPSPQPIELVALMGNTKALGIEIYTNYLYPLQIAAVLLLVAIIAAIALTLRQRKDSKYIDPTLQLKARKQDRLRIIKMQSEKEVPQSNLTDPMTTNQKGAKA